MEIERINENTVKFFIANSDIEKRGFSQEEIWRNKQRGEQLFWEMLEEVQEEIEIEFEGPLMIHVNASDTGLEVLVTKSYPDDPRFAKYGSGEFFYANPKKDYEEELFEESTEYVFSFDSFDDLISLFKNKNMELDTEIYYFQEKYYLFIDFDTVELGNSTYKNILALISEYGDEASETVHVLQEYGKLIMKGNVFKKINQFF